MADMAEAGELKKLKVEHPDALVACYVNSTAAIKAESDICVTSSNALQVIRSLPEDKKIIFVPDKNLGTYIQSQTGRDMIMWDGYCPVHMRISPQDILKRKEEFPGAKVMIHPESTMEAIALADEVLSTGGMCKFAKETDEKVLIAATEIGLLHRLRKENPDKQFVPISEQAVCPTMKMIRLVDVLNCLEKMEHKITVPNNIIDQARLPITRMLDASKSLLKK
jgi:quinolinate synthase